MSLMVQFFGTQCIYWSL